jgi:hypothetical protein
MANVAAIRSVGASLEAYLNRAYAASIFPADTRKPDVTFTLATIGGIQAGDITVSETTVNVLIFLYRVSINQHLRNLGRQVESGARPVPLSVDLRYLFSFWAGSAQNEQLAVAWTMRQLHQVPVLDASMLSGEAAWTPDEVIQLIPEEISHEDMMRIWDAIQPEYRLSVSYIARVIRIDPEETIEHPPVVATRFQYAVPSSRP